MAYNGRYISLQPIMEKIYRDSGEEFVNWEQVIGWTVDLIGLIGIPYSYITKTTNGTDGVDPVQITKYRGILPSDIQQLEAVRYIELSDSGEISAFIPLIETSDIYFKTPTEMLNYEQTLWGPSFKSIGITEGEDGQADVYTFRIEGFPTKLRIRQIPSYKIEGDFIFTNFESGYVEITYKAYPTDQDGYPMIPDDPKYIEAVKWNVMYHLDYINYRKNPSPQNAGIKNDSAQQRDWYVGAAITKSHIPTIDQMESLKNQWLRSITKTNRHSDGFKSLNTPERRYTQNTKRWPNNRRY